MTDPMPQDQRPRDQEARDRIGGSLDENLFIEAGAGTGKTTALVGRMVALVVDEGVAVEDEREVDQLVRLQHVLAAVVREVAVESAEPRLRIDDERRAREHASVGEQGARGEHD